jgi:hypothetical protein
LHHNITTKEQVLEAYIRGDLLKYRNFGKVSHNEVFDWLDKEIDSKLKPMRFVIKKNKPKPLTPSKKLLRSFGHIRTEILNLRAKIRQMNYILERWTHANYELHKSLTAFAIERKYINPTNAQ